MKGPFSFWTFFGITLWIDIITLLGAYLIGKKPKRIDPYKKMMQISVVIPAYMEEEHIESTIRSAYKESYPIKHVIVCGDAFSHNMCKIVNKLKNEFPSLLYVVSTSVSKAKKINHVVMELGDEIGEFLYVRDARVESDDDCIEHMMSCFNESNVAAVTSYGKLSIPKNWLSRAYHYGKAWINEIGRFRKNAQEIRNAVFVVCGASTIYRVSVLAKYPIPSMSKTEDTYYTWLLQMKGFRVRVANNTTVTAPDVDGDGVEGIMRQLRQSFRWSTGTVQCLIWTVKDANRNKTLFYSTILPGFIESLMYGLAIVLIPLFIFISPAIVFGFIIGDAVFSLLGTLILLPTKFFKTLIHYPEICFFKYMNSAVFIMAVFVVTYQAMKRDTSTWSNSWMPPQTA